MPRRRQANDSQEAAGQVPTITADSHPTQSNIQAFAEDLGRLLGSARAKADSWLQQRQAVVKELSNIRDTASELLDRLGHQAATTARGVRRLVGGPRARAAQALSAKANESAPAPERRRRKLSAAARARISAAQKARWAKLRKAAK